MFLRSFLTEYDKGTKRRVIIVYQTYLAQERGKNLMKREMRKNFHLQRVHRLLINCATRARLLYHFSSTFISNIRFFLY